MLSLNQVKENYLFSKWDKATTVQYLKFKFRFSIRGADTRIADWNRAKKTTKRLCCDSFLNKPHASHCAEFNRVGEFHGQSKQ